MLLTLAAVAVRVVSNPFANVFQKQLTTRGAPAVAVNFYTFAVLSLCCAVPAAFIKWSAFPPKFWLYCTLGGIFGATGNALLVKAVSRGELSVLGPINSYKSVVAMAAAFLLYGQVPNAWGLCGVALIIAGSYFILDTMPEGFSLAVLKNFEIRCRIGAMVLTAVEAVFIKEVIIYSSPIAAFIVWCWFGALFSFMLLPLFSVKFNIGTFAGRNGALLALTVACVAAMQYSTNLVFERMEAGYALALFQLSSIVSILLGFKIFNESRIWRKLAGASIMAGGAAVVILLN